MDRPCALTSSAPFFAQWCQPETLTTLETEAGGFQIQGLPGQHCEL